MAFTLRSLSDKGVFAMKQPSSFLKLAVVLSSLLIGGVFICYEAGFRLLAAASRPADPADPVNALTPEQIQFMGGSKSAMVGPGSGADLAVWKLDDVTITSMSELGSPDPPPAAPLPPPQ
jgi:hypothetical protein